MKNFLKNLFWIPVIILVLFAAWLNFSHPVSVVSANARQGSLSLQGWDGSSIVKLDGEWQYYDGLMIQDIQKQNNPQYVDVPNLFANKPEMNGNPYGAATYRLRVEGLDPKILYGIQIINEASAYSLTVNGEEIMKQGTVAFTKQEHQPEMKEKVGFFKADGNGSADILIEISNFSYNYGGFWKPLFIARSDVISGYSLHEDGIEIFLLSSILILGLFFLALFSIKHDFKPPLYFAIIVLLVALRVMLTNNRQFYYLVYNIPWDIGTRLEFLTGYLLLPAFGLFFYSLMYIKKIPAIWYIFIGMGAASIMIMIFTPNEFYANILPYYLNVCIGSLGYFFFVVIQGIRRKKPGAILYLIGMLSFVPAILLDIYTNPTYYFMPFGMFFMIICFSMVVIRDVFEIKKKNDYLEEAILQDPLTGLKNRYYLNKIMDVGLSIPVNHRLYLLFFDLDRFKDINDSYGHHVGDIILIESAKRIRDCLYRESDMVCRYGGDEFIAFVRVRDQESNIHKIIDRILDRFTEPVLAQEKIYTVSVSIGVSEYREGDDLEKIIKESDNAMYQAKKTQPERIMILNKNATL
jgi:diguanylate cyclase (GGDEF) domain